MDLRFVFLLLSYQLFLFPSITFCVFNWNSATAAVANSLHFCTCVSNIQETIEGRSPVVLWGPASFLTFELPDARSCRNCLMQW